MMGCRKAQRGLSRQRVQQSSLARARASPELCDESQAVCCFGPQRERVGEAGTEVVSMSTQRRITLGRVRRT